MRLQEKRAEIDLVEKGLEQGGWEGSKAQATRRKQLGLLRPILSDGLLILDAGCGPGTYGIIFGESNDVIGIDISRKATEVAREKARESGAKLCPLVGDLEKLPFRASSFDVCFFGYTLHHFPDVHAPLAEAARVLKPGGKVVLLEPNGSNPGVKLSGKLENLVRGALAESGLDSPNETLHGLNCYINALRQEGIVDTLVKSHYSGGLPPLPRKCPKLIVILVHLRRLLYAFLSRVLPSPTNGADLLVIGTKYRGALPVKTEEERR
jgi:SAM-dependent methyltransferase